VHRVDEADEGEDDGGRDRDHDHVVDVIEPRVALIEVERWVGGRRTGERKRDVSNETVTTRTSH